ncbi:signal recognition particle protein SRP54, variant [Cryptococcus amylolentus CBS 6039]|uniref:Signal recognition particle 54 kDa protein n=1 Tax=Cryptococcus amylolentus CBS 6039 TaxID=1295533 RepID=A0A1E3HRL2_9TREE|nr:signal recognition particle protein SRP54 [Cryptococcus amylolentus CBS 6039]XP_018993822.1 signal recognition particle protein SRP54, variant [Cryptococcus amylolentus CBS 6039]ODN78775.1 signal recognition particle protein SRP54 [Cryptococcus amylolentus CBS 6039]ODN78776.1 signal recognition particle protein SRP54, variant [Cryptococcus amylolentus CBS 6039]
MVLADLGTRIGGALNQLARAPVVDDSVIDAVLKELCAALLESDVNVKLVASLRSRVKTKVKKSLEESEKAGGKEANKKNVVQKTVFEELVSLVDPGTEPYKPVKGKTNVLMAVGIQGAGKTTTCTKLAVHYQRRGFRTCLVCADTFRAGAFDQLKQNATKAKIPFYGSYTETDPVAIASLGVEKFRKERFDVIIVDTSGRHKQESELFEEMVAIGGAVKPDMTIMVLDASIGQAAEAQSRAFKDSADFGAIIVTKLDGHAKGGGAISAVAATKTPIIFLGTGEHLNDLERFSPQPFISKLLGQGDMQGLMEHMQEMAQVNPDKQKDLAKKIEQGKFSIRDWKDQLSNIMGMGSISKIASMIPGLPAGMMDGGGDEEAASKVKRMIFITDAMRADELDSDGLIFITFDKTGSPTGLNRRAKRVARGSGTSLREVEELLVQVRMMAGMAKQAGGQNGWMSAMQKMQAAAGGKPLGPNGQPSPAQIEAMRKAVPPELARKLRAAGPQGAQKMMADMMGGVGMPGMGGGGGGMPDLGSLMSQLGGGGGGGGLGGMPNMAQMQEMMSSMGMGGAGGGGMPDMSQLMKMMGGGR